MMAIFIVCFLIFIFLVEVVDSSKQIMCGYKSGNYEKAAKKNRDLKDAIKEVEKEPIAFWYSDRDDKTSKIKELKALMSSCAKNKQRPTIVIYGLPQKDCKGGFSSKGYNKNAKDYELFIQAISKIVADNHAVFVIEPDALGLSIDGDCGIKNKYIENIKVAVEIIGENNANVDIYIDTGHWSISSEKKAKTIAKILSKIDAGEKIKGIALNTSNYRSTKEMKEYCERLNKVSKKYHCVIDTSRNNKGPGSKNEWCNLETAGIGAPPTSETGIEVIDYFLWIKPPGESDGECGGRTSDAMKGPKAGEFFPKAFNALFENSYYKNEAGSASNYGLVIGIFISVIAVGIFVAIVVTIRKRKGLRL